MKRFKALQVSLVFIVLILSVFLIPGCSGSGGGNGNAGATAPVVSSVVPLNNAGSVAINTKIAVTFSEAMDQATITGTTFTVVNTTAGGTAVTGTVTGVRPECRFYTGRRSCSQHSLYHHDYHRG